MLGAGEGALLAGPTAARLCGLKGHGSRVVHVLVPAGRRVSARPGVKIHRTHILAAHDALVRGRPPQTTIARSLVDAAQWADTDEAARAILLAGFQQRLTAADELTEVLHRMPRAYRRALIAETIADVAAQIHSALTAAGLPPYPRK